MRSPGEQGRTKQPENDPTNTEKTVSRCLNCALHNKLSQCWNLAITRPEKRIRHHGPSCLPSIHSLENRVLVAMIEPSQPETSVIQTLPRIEQSSQCKSYHDLNRANNLPSARERNITPITKIEHRQVQKG